MTLFRETPFCLFLRGNHWHYKAVPALKTGSRRGRTPLKNRCVPTFMTSMNLHRVLMSHNLLQLSSSKSQAAPSQLILCHWESWTLTNITVDVGSTPIKRIIAYNETSFVGLKLRNHQAAQEDKRQKSGHCLDHPVTQGQINTVTQRNVQFFPEEGIMLIYIVKYSVDKS